MDANAHRLPSSACGADSGSSARALRSLPLCMGLLVAWSLGAPGPAPAAPSGATGFDASGPVAVTPTDTLELRIIPERLELPHNGEASFRVEITGPTGTAEAGTGAVWRSQNRDVAMVGPGGVVRARSPGRTSVSVVVEGRVAIAVVEVLPPAPARIEVELPGGVLRVGVSAPLLTTVVGADGEPVASTGLRFASSDPGVLRVDADGRVHGIAPGQAEVEVRSGEVRVARTIQVEPALDLELSIVPAGASIETGDVLRLRLEGRTTTGDPTPELFPVWTVDRGGASIDAEGAEGVFVAEAPGSYRVSAVLSDELARSVLVEVEPREAAAALELSGRGVLDGHHSGDMWVFEGVDGRDYVYIGTFQHDWMKVFDVTDPTQPILTDSVRLDARRINDVKVHASAELVVVTREGASDRRNGIVILDTRNPAHPVVLSEYTETVTGGVHNVWIEGDLIYACHNGTSDIHIIDIADPANPREVGRWGLDRERKTLHDVIVQDGYAYLSYWDDGVVMLDVGAGTHGGTPTRPTLVSRFSYPQGHTHTAWREGRYLFVGDEIFPMDWDPMKPIEARGYVHVLDMIDPDHPVEVARYEVPEAGAHNVWVEDDRLYVGYYQAGLRVVDISGELRGDLYRQGRELAVIKTTDENSMAPNWPMTWGAQTHKGYIFSSDLNSGLWVTRLRLRAPVVF
jgi:hypothetical protein